MKRYVGVFEIHHPSGRIEKYQVMRNQKNNVHFTSKKQAENAAMQAGHTKLYQSNIPVGSKKVAYAEERNVVDQRKQSNFNNGLGFRFGKKRGSIF